MGEQIGNHEQPHRTKQDILNDYSKAAAELGDITYKLTHLPNDSAKLKEKMHQLNIEMKELLEQEQLQNDKK